MKLGDSVRISLETEARPDDAYYLETEAKIINSRYRFNSMQYHLKWPNGATGWVKRNYLVKADTIPLLQDPEFDLDDIELAEIIMEEMK